MTHTPTLPESKETLDHQVDALRKGRTKAVLVTPGEEMPEFPKRFKTLKTEVGTWIFDPLRMRASRIEAMVEDGTFGALLGHLEPKSIKSMITVTIEIGGKEAKTSQVSPSNAHEQAEELRRQFPGGKTRIGGESLAVDVLNKRTEGKK